jgi:hypothetical protein
LIYSASQTLDRLRAGGRITYHGGLLAVGIEESASGASVTAKDLETGRLQRFSAGRVLVACGGIGTSRLAMGSLELLDAPVNVAESAQFMLPFLSARPTADPQQSADFTLNQFNMVLDLDADGHDVSQLHFYTYNHAFLDAFPSILRSRRARAVRGQLLRRLSVALGYLPSWASPRFVNASATRRVAGFPAHRDVQHPRGRVREECDAPRYRPSAFDVSPVPGPLARPPDA